ncbi:Conserved hypothetical protein [Cryptococcus gattii WM276]|uniref:Uncharacterized protein n=1 Tax=Cryptococcus gattii serotype B (strain WM276 / ATCC MYA-4071) TaxID=367775 RepID=E6RFL2_CRYGW|nr:uncharacterized protein CGB_N3130W [Cryptococcus gattii WM276]ADV25810.1 Conserved hypothetical protein [Cryptococcus gattii WM276]
MILPVHLTGRFQPLDVDFFNHLKYAYHQQLDDFQIGSEGSEGVKGNVLPLAPTCMGAGGDYEADQECVEEVQPMAV